MQSLEVNAERIIDKESFFHSFFKFSSSIFIKEAMASVDMEEDDDDEDEAFDKLSGNGTEFKEESQRKKELKAIVEAEKIIEKKEKLLAHCKNHSKLWVAGALESYEKGNKTKALKEADHALDNLEIAKEAAGLIKDEKEKAEKLKEIALEETNIKLVKEIIKKDEEIDEKKVKVASEEEIFDTRMAVNTYDAKAVEEKPGYRVTKLTVNEDGSEDKKEEVIKISENVTSYKDVPPKEKRELIAADLDDELVARGLDDISEESKKKIVDKIMELDRPDYNQILGREVTSKIAKKKLFEKKLKNRRKIAHRLPPKARRTVSAEINRLSSNVYDVTTDIERDRERRHQEMRVGRQKSFRANNMVAGTDLNNTSENRGSQARSQKSRDYIDSPSNIKDTQIGSNKVKRDGAIDSDSIVDNSSDTIDTISENEKSEQKSTVAKKASKSSSSINSSYPSPKKRVGATNGSTRSSNVTRRSSVPSRAVGSGGFSSPSVSSFSGGGGGGGSSSSAPVQYESAEEKVQREQLEDIASEKKLSKIFSENVKKGDLLADFSKTISNGRKLTISQHVKVMKRNFQKLNKRPDKLRTKRFKNLNCIYEEDILKKEKEQWSATSSIISFLYDTRSERRFCVISENGEYAIIESEGLKDRHGYKISKTSSFSYRMRIQNTPIFKILSNLSAARASQVMYLVDENVLGD